MDGSWLEYSRWPRLSKSLPMTQWGDSFSFVLIGPHLHIFGWSSWIWRNQLKMATLGPNLRFAEKNNFSGGPSYLHDLSCIFLPKWMFSLTQIDVLTQILLILWCWRFRKKGSTCPKWREMLAGNLNEQLCAASSRFLKVLVVHAEATANTKRNLTLSAHDCRSTPFCRNSTFSCLSFADTACFALFCNHFSLLIF